MLPNLRAAMIATMVCGTYCLGNVTATHAQSGDIVGFPHVKVQDGDPAAIEAFVVQNQGSWESERIAFGSDQDALAFWNNLLPLRLQPRRSFFGREVVVPRDSAMVLAEHPADSSRGFAGFPCGDVYFGAGNLILHVPASDTPKPLHVVAKVEGIVRSLLFDTVGTFGYGLLVGTDYGDIYEVDRRGATTKIADLGSPTKATDIVPLGQQYGQFAGQLIIISRQLGRISAIAPSGTVTPIESNRDFSGAEALFINRHFGQPIPYLLHWPLHPEQPYSRQELSGDIFAVAYVRHHVGRELLMLRAQGSHFEAAPLLDLVNTDEITFLARTNDPQDGHCPATRE